MDDLYRDQILDHYKSPRHHGKLTHPDARAEGENPLCGDHYTVDLAIADGRVTDIAFEGRGCSISQAALSMLTDEVIGKTVEDVAAITRDEIVEMLGIPLSPVRLKCALLGLSTIRVALHRHSGTPLPESFAGLDEIEWR